MPQGLPYFNQGQSGLDVVAAILSPIELPSAANLQCWYDVDQETGHSDGDTLDPFTNQISGAPANSHFNATNTPTYETNELDGEPVVEFGTTLPGDNYATSDNLFHSFMHQAASSMLIIFKPEDHVGAADTVWDILSNDDLGLSGFEFRGQDNQMGIRFRLLRNNSIQLQLSVLNEIVFGTWYIIFIRHSGAGGEATMYIDNISVATDPTVESPLEATNHGPCKIAIRVTEVDNEYAGQISQILMWDADVESDRQALHDYFADRFPTLNL